MDSNFKEIAANNFKNYDKDKSGYIDANELQKLMTDVAKEIGIPAPDDSEIQETMGEFDKNKDKKISSDEFVHLFEVIYEMKKNK